MFINYLFYFGNLPLKISLHAGKFCLILHANIFILELLFMDFTASL